MDPTRESTNTELVAGQTEPASEQTGNNEADTNASQTNDDKNTATPIDEDIPPKPATKEEEKNIIKEIEAKANVDGFHLGDTWYVISTKWWRSWKNWVMYDYESFSSGTPPGPINNEVLVDPKSEPGKERILTTSLEGSDFVLMSSDMWKVLQSWYGGGPALPRKVIDNGSSWNSRYVVEIRLLKVQVFKSSAPDAAVTMNFSKTTTVGSFKREACAQMGLDMHNVRVWDYHGNTKFKLLEDMSERLDKAQIIDGQPILLEERDANGKFSEITRPRGILSGYSSYSNSGGPTDPGTTGLSNLGNTCFMNSSLQCLSNTPPLTNYFLTDQFKNDINSDNPLGMHGELAEEYASLIKTLWSGSCSATAPRDFKWKLERFAPQFAGYQQHDSQELLAFLLDGLHEDLNRIKKKPYTENPEVGDRPQEEVAEEAWKMHKARNDSIIVDYFQGQLKSTLVCPKCDRVSITFDPFMYLSLPLPMKTTRTINVTLFYYDHRKNPTRFSCEVAKHGNINTLKAVLSGLSGVSKDCLIIIDVYNSRFFKHFEDEGLDSIQDRDFICAYEILPSSAEEEDPNQQVMYFPVLQRREEASHNMYHGGDFVRKSLCGLPFVLSVTNPSQLTYKQLYDMIYLQISRYLRLPKGRIFYTMDDLKDKEDDVMLTTSSSTIPSSSVDSSSSNTTSGSGAPRVRNEDSDTDDDVTGERSKGERSDEEDDSNRLSKKTRTSKPLFVIRLVDSYGTNDSDPLVDNDKPLNLPDRSTLAVCWYDKEIFEAVYDEDSEKKFDLHSSFVSANNKEQESANDSNSITLNRCIDLFNAEEQLGPDDPWYCNRCKEFQQATKKFDLWRLPPILVVHLKRFSYKNRYWREKLETLVNYPVHNLDLSEFALGPTDVPPIYDLYAVSNHYGSLGGGHYTAYAKNKDDGKWYKFDDSHVQEIDENKVVTTSAYVLFYKRKDVTVTPSTNTNNNNNNNNLQDMEQDNNASVGDAMEQ